MKNNNSIKGRGCIVLAQRYFLKTPLVARKRLPPIPQVVEVYCKVFPAWGPWHCWTLDFRRSGTIEEPAEGATVGWEAVRSASHVPGLCLVCHLPSLPLLPLTTSRLCSVSSPSFSRSLLLSASGSCCLSWFGRWCLWLSLSCSLIPIPKRDHHIGPGIISQQAWVGC